MPLKVTQTYKNLPKNLEYPEGDLVILTGPNNSGKSALLQYINMYSELKDEADYISPRRFDLSNEVAIALNDDEQLRNMWNERKSYNKRVAEFNAPDSVRELLSLTNDSRKKVCEWHNRYFGDLIVERSKPDNDYAAPLITVDGRLPTEQGSGSRAVLSVLCSLLHPTRKIILIDEPEIGIEPQVQKRLATLIRKVAVGQDDLPKKRIYVATHSHLFLDRENFKNNWIVTKNKDGFACLTQIKAREELHDLIYRLLGNSPDDLFFPDNILIVEGPSDHIFWRKLMALTSAGGIAVHYAEGDTNVSHALPAIEQMLRTLAYTPWYKNRICVAVDASVPDTRIQQWRQFLGDDGTRVRRLQKNGIEFYYPSSLMREITGLEVTELEANINTFAQRMRHGAKDAAIGQFSGSKRDLASEVANRIETRHFSEIDSEIHSILNIVKSKSFTQESTSVATTAVAS